jgi:hypothetical protein
LTVPPQIKKQEGHTGDAKLPLGMPFSGFIANLEANGTCPVREKSLSCEFCLARQGSVNTDFFEMSGYWSCAFCLMKKYQN